MLLEISGELESYSFNITYSIKFWIDNFGIISNQSYVDQSDNVYPGCHPKVCTMTLLGDVNKLLGQKKHASLSEITIQISGEI